MGSRNAYDPSVLPQLSCDERAPRHWPAPTATPGSAPGLYAIVDSSERLRAVLAAGVRTVQLRIKQPPGEAALREILRDGLAAAAPHGATLYINDHWQLALELGAPALHLGQEDLLGLTAGERDRLREAQARGLRLGLSSHSLWELARAAAWCPSYIACGPVWPTTTKAMPWRPQGCTTWRGGCAWLLRPWWPSAASSGRRSCRPSRRRAQKAAAWCAAWATTRGAH